MFELAQIFHNEDSSHIFGEFKLQTIKIHVSAHARKRQIFEWDSLRAKNTPDPTAVPVNCGTAPWNQVANSKL
jgi:hypothetical protein